MRSNRTRSPGLTVNLPWCGKVRRLGGNIFVQRFDSAGQNLGDAFGLRGADASQDSPRLPKVAQRDNGDFIVVWIGYEADRLLFSRVVGKDGQPKGPPEEIGFGHEQGVAARSNGEFVVSSTPHYSTYSFFDHKVHAWRLQSEGAPQPGNFEVTSRAIDGYYVPTNIADLDDGRVLLVWYDGSRISGQRLTAPCVGDEQNTCLGAGDRFEVRVEWTDFNGLSGTAKGVPTEARDSGLLYFFNEENWELLVKIVDGCGFNDHYWVFAAATTNVEYTLTVTDTVGAKSRSWTNPLGTSAPALTETTAFATCP